MKNEFSIVLIPTYSCNCSCTHCFEEIVPISIDDNSWDSYFDGLRDFAQHQKLDRLLIYWQGGEVMMLKHETVRRGLDRCRTVMKDAGIEVEHHLQSNLLLYQSNWRDTVAEYFRGNISSSLDYPNLFRKYKGSEGESYNKLWLEKKLEAEADGLIVNLITLPNQATLEQGAAEFYRYFSEDIGTRNVQINFPFTGVDGVNPAPLSLDKLGDFMQELYRIWVNSDRYLNLNPFFALENRINNNNGRLPCVWAHNCANFIMAVGPDGEIGQCDCWVSTHKEFDYGVLGVDGPGSIWNSANRDKFVERPERMIQDPECSECEYWAICFGGCPIRALAFSGDIYSRDYYCPAYKRIFRAVLENM
jgi:uncharacterized protein